MMQKKLRVLTFAVLVFLCLGIQVSGSAPSEIWPLLEDEPIAIAHRGASSLAPENTLAAVQQGLDLGAPWIEIDVHRTQDGELVVIHDPTLDRTTNGTGSIINQTLCELKKLDAGAWFNSDFTGESIPTLQEVLTLVKDQAVLLIELKASWTENRTLELIRELDMADQVVIQSFDIMQVARVNERAPDIPTVLLISEPGNALNPQQAAEWMVNSALYTGANGVGVRYRYVTPELIELAADNQLAVFPWTVDSQSDMLRFIEMGVDGIITNRPQDLL